jgi:hypothetical protein
LIGSNPQPLPQELQNTKAALISLKDDDYVVASLRHKFPRRDPSESYITEFGLHLYRSSSPDDGWVTTRLSVENRVRDPLPRAVADLVPYHEMSNTVTIGSERDTVAWVDLWCGVILCDVLDDCPVLRDVLCRLLVSYPTISMDGHAVYFLSNVDELDVVVAVDMKKKTHYWKFQLCREKGCLP